MASFKMVGVGRVFVREPIKGVKGFSFKYLGNDLLKFERMKDSKGEYFRIYPRFDSTKYDSCQIRAFKKMFEIESEVEINV